MTKSACLILGDAPERLLQRHHVRDEYAGLSDVSDAVSDCMATSSTLKEALQQVFGATDQVWMYDPPDTKPDVDILHPHVVLKDGAFVKAFRPTEDWDPTLSREDAHQHRRRFYDQNRFDYWFEPQTAYLPLRKDLSAKPLSARTQISQSNPYWEGQACANRAVRADIDLTVLQAARKKTTQDLLSKGRAALQAAGFDPGVRWTPRHTTRFGDTKASQTWSTQEPVKALLAHMPEHEKRLDFLLLNESALTLWSDWGALPIAGFITEDRYHDCTPPADASREEHVMYQITSTHSAFLEALRDAWLSCPPDRLCSVYTVHE